MVGAEVIINLRFIGKFIIILVSASLYASAVFGHFDQNNADFVVPSKYLSVFTDTLAELKIRDIKQKIFHREKPDILNRPLSNAAHAYWMKVAIPAEELSGWYADNPDTLYFYCGKHDDMKLYREGREMKGGLIHKNSRAFGEQFYFPLAVGSGQDLQFTVRIRDLIWIKAPLEAQLFPEKFKEEKRIERIGKLFPYIAVSICFFSFIGFIFLFSLTQYIQIRDKSYLFYAVYLMTLLLYFLRDFEAKTDFVILFSHFPGWIYYSDPFLSLGGIVIYLYFVFSFLELGSNFPGTQKGLQYFTAGIAAFLVLSSLVILFSHPRPYNVRIYFTLIGILFPALLAFVLHLIRCLKSPLSYYVLFGTIFLFIGQLFFILYRDENFGRTPENFWEMNPVYGQLGAMLEILCLSLGLGYKNKLVLEEKNRAEQTLLLQESKYNHLRVQQLESEINALKAQMNPHFISNCLNAIKLLIQENKGEQAIQYLIEFSELVRFVVEYSMEPRITLDKELNMCRLYLKMESLRLDHNFQYEIRVAEGLDTSYADIPPFLIQPFLENAVWHGLQPKKQGERKLSLLIREEADTLIFIIDDNGIGRAKAGDLFRSSFKKKSVGIRNVKERIAFINTLQDTQISIKIIDKIDAKGIPTGTRVEIAI